MTIPGGTLPFKPVANSQIDWRVEQEDNHALIEQAYPSSMASLPKCNLLTAADTPPPQPDTPTSMY